MACVTKRRGRWILDYYDQHGQRRWKTMAEGTTKEVAEGELTSIKRLINAGAYVPPGESKSLVFSQVASDWLQAKNRRVRHSTLRGWRGHLENHLVPHFGQTPIARVNFNAVENFISECEKKEVSIPTTKKILQTLGQIMGYACKKRYVDHNPVREVEKPKRETDQEEAEEVEIYSPAEVQRLIDGVGWVSKEVKVQDGKTQKVWTELPPEKKLKYRTLYMVAVGTGMRQGEIIGLQWDDINWNTAQLEVKRTFNHGRWYPPKTKTSRRKIDLAPQLIFQLAEWKRFCPPSERNLVFPNGFGRPINSSHLYNRIHVSAIERAGVARKTFHSLRHTFTSILIDQGESITYIQRQLGHSKASTTLDIYSHLFKNENPDAAKKLGNTIFGQLDMGGSKMVANEGSSEKALAVTGWNHYNAPVAQMDRAADF